MFCMHVFKMFFYKSEKTCCFMSFIRKSMFLPCDAMRCTVLVIVILSVRPSVRPSVTPVDCVHMVRPTIMISSPYGSPIILVSEDIKLIPKFEGNHPEWGRWMRVGWLRISDFRPISRRISETVRDTTKVTINHYALSIVTKINDLGWPWNDLGRQLCTPLHYTRVSELTQILIKIDLYYQRQKCSAGILVSS